MPKRLTGSNSLAYLGVNAVTPANMVQIGRAPTANDYYNFDLGTFWLDTAALVVYTLTNKDAQVATWSTFGGGSGATTFNTDGSSATVSGNAITIAGGTNITTAGAAATVTVNLDDSVSLSGTLDVTGDVTVDTGDIVATNGDIGTLAGGITSATVVEAGSSMTAATDITTQTGDLIATLGGLTVKTGIQVEDFGAGVVQTDASGIFSSTKGTDGQILISSTAGVPAWANITSTGATITISNTANGINIEAGATSALMFDTDGSSATPSGNTITIAGGTGITTSGSGATVTIDLDSPVTVANGGTGASTLTGVLTGNGTSAVTANTVTQYAVLLGGASNAVSEVSGVGTSGQVLTSNGAAMDPTWQDSASAPTVAWTLTAIDDTDSPYTVLSSDQYISANSNAGTISVLLPNAPSTGRVYTIKDAGGDAASNNITVTTVGGSVTIDGSTSYVMNTAYQAINVIFNGTSYEIF